MTATKDPRRRRPPATRAIPAPAHAWDRRQDESAPAFEAFQAYRDLGPRRSLRAVREQIPRNRGTVSEWSSKYQWVARAELWDAENDRIRQRAAMDAHRQAIIDMGSRHADLAERWLVSMRAVMEEFIDRLVKDPAELQQIATADLVALVRLSGSQMPRVAEMERVARGIMPNEPIDEAKLRATIRSEVQLEISGEEVHDVDQGALRSALQTLLEAGVLNMGQKSVADG